MYEITVTFVTKTSAGSPSRIRLGGAKVIHETELNLPTTCGTLCCFGVKRSGVTTRINKNNTIRR